MDKDLRSIAAARQAATSAFAAYQKFREFDPSQVNEIVDAMAQAIEPEAARLGQLAVAIASSLDAVRVSYCCGNQFEMRVFSMHRIHQHFSQGNLKSLYRNICNVCHWRLTGN